MARKHGVRGLFFNTGTAEKPALVPFLAVTRDGVKFEGWAFVDGSEARWKGGVALGAGPGELREPTAAETL